MYKTHNLSLHFIHSSFKVLVLTSSQSFFFYIRINNISPLRTSQHFIYYNFITYYCYIYYPKLYYIPLLITIWLKQHTILYSASCEGWFHACFLCNLVYTTFIAQWSSLQLWLPRLFINFKYPIQLQLYDCYVADMLRSCNCILLFTE